MVSFNKQPNNPTITIQEHRNGAVQEAFSTCRAFQVAAVRYADAKGLKFRGTINREERALHLNSEFAEFYEAHRAVGMIGRSPQVPALRHVDEELADQQTLICLLSASIEVDHWNALAVLLKTSPVMAWTTFAELQGVVVQNAVVRRTPLEGDWVVRTLLKKAVEHINLYMISTDKIDDTRSPITGLTGAETALGRLQITQLLLCNAVGCDLPRAMEAKFQFGMTRPYLHGKRF
jgi:hypothetical protein